MKRNPNFSGLCSSSSFEMKHTGRWNFKERFVQRGETHAGYLLCFLGGYRRKSAAKIFGLHRGGQKRDQVGYLKDMSILRLNQLSSWPFLKGSLWPFLYNWSSYAISFVLPYYVERLYYPPLHHTVSSDLRRTTNQIERKFCALHDFRAMWEVKFRSRRPSREKKSEGLLTVIKKSIDSRGVSHSHSTHGSVSSR
jgi:hypothetical protein